MKTKIKITILALVTALVLSIAALITINFKPASALNGTNVFTVSGESGIVADKQGDGSDAKYYTMFTFGYDEDNVSLRKNLAYNWYEERTEEGSEEKSVVNEHFSMEIGFKHNDFKKFVIAFESQQFTKTEEGKTVNYLIFFPDGDGVKALITDDKDAVVDNAPDEQKNTVLPLGRLKINFTGKRIDGEYGITVSGEDGASVSGAFVNVGGNYAKYSSSSTTPVYPLIFSAQFEKAEEGTENKVAQMLLYSLNNQSFEVKSPTASEGHDYYVNGTVTDDTSPVLCLNKEITHLSIGGQVKFDYQVIDVMRDYPSSELNYYALQYADTQKEVNFNDRTGDLYSKVEGDILLDSDKDTYLPSLPEDGGSEFNNENFTVDMAVKAYVKLSDTSASSSTDSYVYLDWYVKDGYKLNIKGYDFIAVGDDLAGVTYNTGFSWVQLCNEYQAKVTKAASNLSAGSSSYFYLPSAESLFYDNSTPYQDMKISIYYYSDSQSSNTSLAANNLSINVTKPGTYVFTLYATDGDGNDMYYLDGDGKPVKFSGSDIWTMYGDDEKHDLLPWFSFTVDYTGAYFKTKPEKQSTAYVGNSYSSASFDINGISGSYQTNYRLFIFDRAGYYNDNNNTTFTYDEFIEKMDGLFEGENTRKYFKEIKQVKEGDEDYDEFKDYAWSNTSTSFVPQEANAFYYMRAEVTDTQYNTEPVTCSLAIVSSAEAKKLKGDSEWLKNNLASVILLTVAGISLVAIVLLLVIKPKSKEDIDVQFEKEKSKKSK